MVPDNIIIESTFGLFVGRCNCTFPDLFVHRITVPGPPIIQIVEKTVPVPIVVVKQVEVTRLVPFEPTPPGFGPIDWKPGMGRPDLSKTRLLPPRPTASIGAAPDVNVVEEELDEDDEYVDDDELLPTTTVGSIFNDSEVDQLLQGKCLFELLN
jgi:hypothetical protein